MDATVEAVLANMLFTLANAQYPWGFKILPAPSISRIKDRWTMCPGNWLTIAEMDEALAAELVSIGPKDRFGRPTLAIASAGRAWLADHPPQPPYLTGREG